MTDKSWETRKPYVWIGGKQGRNGVGVYHVLSHHAISGLEQGPMQNP